MQLPQLAKMDTDVANLSESFAEARTMPPVLEDDRAYIDCYENLDSRLYDLAERLVSLVDDDDNDDDDDYDDDVTFNDGGKMATSVKIPQENLDAERLLISASYTQCMQEALRFLVQEEGFAQNDVMVVGLQRHLEVQKSTAVERAVNKTQKARCRPIRGPALY